MKETNTYKKFKDKPRDNFPVKVIIHHSGGTVLNPKADTSHHTAEGIEKQHLSQGFEGLGYQYVIHFDGEVWAGRPEHFHAAHTVDHNKNSIGICLAGNFDVTLPSEAQINSLKKLLLEIQSRYPNITNKEIYPHRKFATKSCYGVKLEDDWGSKLLVETQSKAEIKRQITDLLEKL